MVKGGEFLADDEILEERRATLTGLQRMPVIDGHTLIGGEVAALGVVGLELVEEAVITRKALFLSLLMLGIRAAGGHEGALSSNAAGQCQCCESGRADPHCVVV